MKIKAGKQGMI